MLKEIILQLDQTILFLNLPSNMHFITMLIVFLQTIKTKWIFNHLDHNKIFINLHKVQKHFKEVLDQN